MTQDDVLQEFREAGALLEGHFILSSGLHSARYLQCARVLMNPARAERLCKALADKVRSASQKDFDLVASPAMGGVVVGYEMARQFAVGSIFFERVESKLTLRRGFDIPTGARVLMVEDIVTTGLSSRECIEGITREGGRVIAAACLIDRSAGTVNLGVPLYALAQLDIPTFTADALPPELAAAPAVKPGSRGMKA
jgi:orotate phosphoribosyltransferase